MPGAIGSPAALFNARVQGATGGVTARGGQSVFAASVAPQRSAAAAASARTATGDLWSGLGASTSPSAATVAASGAGEAAPGIGMAMLGVGLAGILGLALATFFVPALRRRRAAAETGTGASGSGSASM